MGLPASIVADLAEAEPQGFAIWPSNMPIVDAWLEVCSQWNVIALANGRMFYQGLRYGDARAGLRQAGMALTPSQWLKLRVMESAAASSLNGVRG